MRESAHRQSLRHSTPLWSGASLSPVAFLKKFFAARRAGRGDMKSFLDKLSLMNVEFHELQHDSRTIGDFQCR
jgi:hypothetical protein